MTASDTVEGDLGTLVQTLARLENALAELQIEVRDNRTAMVEARGDVALLAFDLRVGLKRLGDRVVGQRNPRGGPPPTRG